MSARDVAKKLGQNLEVFDLRNLLLEGETDKFLDALKQSPALASTPLDEKNGEVLLLVAIKCNNTECAKALIDSGANIDQMDMFRKSLILETIQCELFELSQYLIEKGAAYDPGSVGDYGRHLSPKYAQDGLLSEDEYNSLIDNIKKGIQPKTNF